MSSEEDLKIKNADSLSQQRATRRKRSKLKDLRKQEKESLQGASSTSRRREVKGYYEEQRGKIMDVSVNPPQSENQDGANNDTSQAGIDSSVEHGGGGGGGGLPDGYVETAVIICVNGSPVSGQFLFKEDTT